MQRHDFYTAVGVADKFFNTSSMEASDLELTVEEVDNLCKKAWERVSRVFPAYAPRITITAETDTEDEFAGYVLKFTSQSETAQSFEHQALFDYGTHGINVVEKAGDAEDENDETKTNTAKIEVKSGKSKKKTA